MVFQTRFCGGNSKRKTFKFQRLKPHAADPGEDQGLNWQASRLAGWQIGRQASRLAGWLAGWLADWQARAVLGCSRGALGTLLSALGALLGRSWDAPCRPERGQERQNSSPKLIFCVFFERHFSHHISHRFFFDFSSIFRRSEP